MLTGVAILVLVSFFSYIFSLKNRLLIYSLLLSQFTIYLFIITLLSPEYYSDRGNYISWLADSEKRLEHADIVFAYFLHAVSFFSNDPIWFFLIFGIIILTIIFFTAKNYLLKLPYVGIFFILLIPNRFFLEFSMNSMRAFLLSILLLWLLHLIFYKKKYLFILCVPILFFIHKGMFLLILAAILGASIIRSVFFCKWLFIISTTLFILGIKFNYVHLFVATYVEPYVNLYMVGGVNRYIEYGDGKNLIARLQIFITYILPAYILISKLKYLNNLDTKIFKFILLSISFVIIFTPMPIFFRLLSLVLIVNFLLFVKYYNKRSLIEFGYIVSMFLINSLVLIKGIYGDN